MCVNYRPARRQEIIETFKSQVSEDLVWPDEVYKDYLAPIIRTDDAGMRETLLAAYSMVPKQHMPPKVKPFSTMNARAETVGTLRSYSSAWKNGQLALVPMIAFYEPNWEGEKHVRYRIGMADESPFAVAGLWRTWTEADGMTSYSFTQLTINADDHPLMNRFHKSGEEKRSLVIVPKEDYDAWLMCRDMETARSFLRPYPAELMAARPEPKTVGSRKTDEQHGLSL